MTIILTAGLLPAIILLVFVFKQDKVEKEPMGLLISLLILGALACFPASIFENILISGLDYFLGSGHPLYYVIETFFIIAVCEEGFKLLFLKKRTWNSPDFNFTFDGIVYSVFVGLGFAGLENLMYITNFGLSVAIGRGLLSIPGHCTFAVFMGFFYSHAKYWQDYGDYAKAKLCKAAAFLAPVLLHGFFDFCLINKSVNLTMFFFVFVIIVDIVAFITIKVQSKNDQTL